MKCSRNYVTMLKKQLKQNYFKKSIRDSKGNSKKLWKSIKEAFGQNSKSTPITNINGQTEPALIAEELNTFLATIADKLASDFP